MLNYSWAYEFFTTQVGNYMALKDRLILVDSDGVLLDWEFAFEIWMREHGFNMLPDGKLKYSVSERYGISEEQTNKLIKLFNESAAMGFLPPLRDAMFYVKRLHEEHGFQFHCITSMSDNENAIFLREMNLKKLFGETAFKKITCLATCAPKDKELEKYKDSGCWWVEDTPKNVEAGLSAGLRPILVEHGYNMHYNNSGVQIVKNWRQIYELVTSSC